MTQSKATKRSAGDAGPQVRASVLETRAGRIYRENLAKMTTSSLTKWSSTQAANGSESAHTRPH